MAFVRNTIPNGNFQKLDAITFDGTTLTYALTIGGVAKAVGNANQLLISIAGVIQEPNVAYTVVDATITFAVAPNVNHTFFGILLGERLNLLAPGANTVSTTALQDGSVTAAKLASGAANTTSAKVFGMMMA